MKRSIFSKTRYLLVAVFSVFLSITLLMFSMLDAYAAGEDTTILEPNASENYTLPYSKGSRLFMGNYSEHQSASGIDDDDNYGLHWEWNGWATDGNSFLLKANTTYTVTVTDMAGTSIEGVKYAIYGRIYLGAKTGGTINNIYCTIQREGQALQSATMSGSRIVGWFPDLYGTGSRITYTITNNDSSDQVLYYAYFDLFWGDGKTIVLDYNDKEYGSTKSETFVHFYYAYSSVAVPTRDGYKFLGYYDQKEGGTQFYKADGSPTHQTFDLNQDESTQTLYAHWELAENTITLNKNGGTGGSDSVVATQGKAMPSAIMPTKVGYDFLGYYDTNASTGGKQYYTSSGASASIWDKTVDTTLYARWQLKSEIQDVINKINAIGTVSYPGSKAKINTARSAYNALSNDHKALVSNYNTLTTAESTYTRLKANAISNTINLIDAIGEVTYPNSKDAIVSAEAAYSALDNDDKAEVTNYETLKEARTEYDRQGVEKINEVIEAINAIDPEITYPTSESVLANANGLYNALDDLEKPKVTNYNTLVGYNETYATLREAAVNNVIELINAISTPFDLDNYKAQINAARSAFDKLGDNDKNKEVVTNLDKLLDAEAAAVVVVLIQSIGQSSDSEAYRNRVNEANETYMALTSTKKDFIPADLLKVLTDNIEIVSVMDLINNIGSVKYTSESKELIDIANEAYDDLDDSLKDSIVNYQKLVDANNDYDKVDESAIMIINIPEFEYTPEFKAIIDDARNTYDALSDDQKSIMPEEIYEKLLEVEKIYQSYDSIVNIGEIENTNASRERVKKAKKDYDSLTNTQEEFIPADKLDYLNNAIAVWNVIDMVNDIKSGYQTSIKTDIDNAKTALNSLITDQKNMMPESVKTLLADKEVAYEMMVEINDLYTVEYSSEYKEALDAAKVDYDALTDSQKELVNNYVVLSVNLQSYNNIDDAYNKIENIGKVKYSKNSKKAIEDARKAYNKVKDKDKELILNSETLFEAEAKYEKAEHNHNIAMGWVKGLCIFFGLTLLCALTFFIIIIILKRRKEKEEEENKKNKKGKKK